MFFTKKLRSFLLLFVCLLLTITAVSSAVDDEDGTVDKEHEELAGADKAEEEIAGADEEQDEIAGEEDVQEEEMFSEDLEDGDVELTETQKIEFENEALMRSGAFAKKYMWPKTKLGKYAIIPYVIDETSNYTIDQLAIIDQAMKDIETKTCVRFRRHENQNDYIRIYSGNGCTSRIGKIGGMQNLSLSRRACVVRKKVVHELMHAIGFTHMHQRFDRDEFVTVFWKNIKEANKFAFKKKKNRYEAYDTKYDYLSCMHYPKENFSVNKKNTLVPKDRDYLGKIGRVITLSEGDALRINRMYTCPM